MKKLVFLLLIASSLPSFSQTITFRDNLFDSVRISIEVIKTADYYLLTFTRGDRTASDSLFNWKVPLIQNALIKHFPDDCFRDRISGEAGRIFYELKLIETAGGAEGDHPVAGIIGFENNEVYLSMQSNIMNKYKKYVKDAIKYSRSYPDSTMFHYMQFIVIQNKNHRLFEKKRIIDTLLFRDRTFTKRELMIQGGRAQENYISNIAINTYSSLDSLRLRYEEMGKAYMILDSLSAGSQEILLFDDFLDFLSRAVAMQGDTIYLTAAVRQMLDTFTNKLRELQVKDPKDKLITTNLNLMYKLDSLNNQRDSSLSTYMVGKDFIEVSAEMKEMIDNQRIYLVKYKDIAKKTEALNKRQREVMQTVANYKLNILKCRIDSIEVEITKSFINNLIAYGTVEYFDFQNINSFSQPQRQIMIRNVVPIGISTLNALDRNNRKIRLYAVVNQRKYSLPLNDVLAFYRPVLKSQRLDYSPADTSFTVVKNEKLQVSSLKKETSSELFELKIFTDFVGIEGSHSNGLVQTEFSKEMYLNPYQFCSKSQRHSPYWGFGAYIKPGFTLSKIEETNKYFNPAVVNDTAYIPTLALKEYEIYSMGFDVNMVSLSLPFLKSMFYFDSGMYFGRTGIADSTYLQSDSVLIVNRRGVNTLTINGNLRYYTQPDERYFYEIRGFFQYANLLKNDVRQSSKAGDFTSTDFTDKSLLGIEFFAGYSPYAGSDGKLFVRFRYTYSPGSRDGFSQLQMGYSKYFRK